MRRPFSFSGGLKAALLLSMAWLAGCATGPRLPEAALAHLPARTELTATPFFPQEQHLCGPAALATLLTAAGQAADPKDLEPWLYLPAREGTLQAEMLATARRQGALALPAPSDLAGLFSELADGRPVLVLQNLGLSWVPRWHYAVVIGHDLPAGQVILRSGVMRREVMALRTFELTWARSGHWGMIISPPGELPASATVADTELALAALEKFAAAPKMIIHYETAARRWPDSLLLQIGLGNAYAKAHRLDGAEQAFRSAVEHHPRSAVALNNLASVLQSRGNMTEALQVADRALEAAGDGEWHAPVKATRDEIRAALQSAAPSPP